MKYAQGFLVILCITSTLVKAGQSLSLSATLPTPLIHLEDTNNVIRDFLVKEIKTCDGNNNAQLKDVLNGFKNILETQGLQKLYYLARAWQILNHASNSGNADYLLANVNTTNTTPLSDLAQAQGKILLAKVDFSKNPTLVGITSFLQQEVDDIKGYGTANFKSGLNPDAASMQTANFIEAFGKYLTLYNPALEDEVQKFFADDPSLVKYAKENVISTVVPEVLNNLAKDPSSSLNNSSTPGNVMQYNLGNPPVQRFQN